MADHDRIEKVARALCVADGHDPEERGAASNMHLVEAEFGITVTAPAWTNYISEATRFIAALVALGMLE